MLLAAMCCAVPRALPIFAAAFLLVHIAVLLPTDSAAASNNPSHCQHDDGCSIRFWLQPIGSLGGKNVVGTKLCQNAEVDTKAIIQDDKVLLWGEEPIDTTLDALQKEVRAILHSADTLGNEQIIIAISEWHIDLGNDYYINFQPNPENYLLGWVRRLASVQNYWCYWDPIGASGSRVVNVNGNIFLGQLKLGITMHDIEEFLGVKLEQDEHIVSREFVDEIIGQTVELTPNPSGDQSDDAGKAAGCEWPIEEMLENVNPQTPTVQFSLLKVSEADSS